MTQLNPSLLTLLKDSLKQFTQQTFHYSNITVVVQLTSHTCVQWASSDQRFLSVEHSVFNPMIKYFVQLTETFELLLTLLELYCDMVLIQTVTGHMSLTEQNTHHHSQFNHRTNEYINTLSHHFVYRYIIDPWLQH